MLRKVSKPSVQCRKCLKEVYYNNPPPVAKYEKVNEYYNLRKIMMMRSSYRSDIPFVIIFRSAKPTAHYNSS